MQHSAGFLRRPHVEFENDDDDGQIFSVTTGATDFNGSDFSEVSETRSRVLFFFFF